MTINSIFFIVSLIFGLSCMVLAEGKSKAELLEEENKEFEKKGIEIANLYDLPEGVDLLDVTDKVLASSQTKDVNKKKLQDQQRRIFIFTYPSDGLKIKGFVSFVPTSSENPLIVFLRGGNRKFGVLNPGGAYSFPKNYTVLVTAYRGGISEGEDEFGGNDVNDVKNLIDYIPELEQKLNRVLGNEKRYMIGGSRGGLQMFLTLARFPELQDKFTKIISLSGLTNLRGCIAEREDMKKMFIDDFGLIENGNEDEWINSRDPIVAVEKLRKDLPVLIIHGTNDIRITRNESYSMVERLTALGNDVTYLEVENAEHCLTNLPDPTQHLLDWIERE